MNNCIDIFTSERESEWWVMFMTSPLFWFRLSFCRHQANNKYKKAFFCVGVALVTLVTIFMRQMKYCSKLVTSCHILWHFCGIYDNFFLELGTSIIMNLRTSCGRPSTGNGHVWDWVTWWGSAFKWTNRWPGTHSHSTILWTTFQSQSSHESIHSWGLTNFF